MVATASDERAGTHLCTSLAPHIGASRGTPTASPRRGRGDSHPHARGRGPALSPLGPLAVRVPYASRVVLGRERPASRARAGWRARLPRRTRAAPRRGFRTVRPARGERSPWLAKASRGAARPAAQWGHRAAAVGCGATTFSAHRRRGRDRTRAGLPAWGMPACVRWTTCRCCEQSTRICPRAHGSKAQE